MDTKKLFIISDLHAWHTNIIKYCNRPFFLVEEMNEYMIDKWNSVVTKEDWVICAGDMFFGRECTLNRAKEFRAKLHGSIIEARGNHDKIFSARRWLEVIKVQHYLQKHLEHVVLGQYVIVYLKKEPCNDVLEITTPAWRNKKIIYISHVPILKQYLGPYYYGHIHTNEPHIEEEMLLISPASKNMCVERNDYTPVLIGEIVE